MQHPQQNTWNKFEISLLISFAARFNVSNWISLESQAVTLKLTQMEYTKS